jgi:osmotically inducible lipoprotein OsmB
VKAAFAAGALAIAALVGLSGCAGMSQRDQNIAVGAGVGAVGGAVLTGGSALGTVGGAAVGGVIGNEIGKNR